MHKHNAEETKKILNRMSKIVGHANSIKTMIEEERDCSEILIQIAAVRSALNNVGKIILEDHIDHCVFEALLQEDSNKDKILFDLKDAIDKFIK